MVVERELGGDRQPVDIGLPSVRVMLELPVSVEEYAALIDLEGDVTVRVFNKSLGTWGNYNGVMVVDREKRTWGNDEWDRAQFEVFDLEAI